MTGPAVVSVARIEPDLARRSWARVRRLVARDDPGGASDDLRCFIAVFGHGDGVPETIERVRRILAAGMPCQRSRESDKFSTLVGALGSGTGLLVWILR